MASHRAEREDAAPRSGPLGSGRQELGVGLLHCGAVTDGQSRPGDEADPRFAEQVLRRLRKRPQHGGGVGATR